MTRLALAALAIRALAFLERHELAPADVAWAAIASPILVLAMLGAMLVGGP